MRLFLPIGSISAMLVLGACGNGAPPDSSRESVDTGLRETKRLRDLNAPENQALCQAVSDAVGARSIDMTRIFCVGLVGAFAESRQACEEVVATQCNDGALETPLDESEAECATEVSSECGATVSEYEACITETLDLFERLSNVTCDDISASPEESLETAMPACAALAEKCPNDFDTFDHHDWCSLHLELRGVVSEPAELVGCGWSYGDSVKLSFTQLFEAPDFEFEFPRMRRDDPRTTLPVRITINANMPPTWQTPEGACTAEFTAGECQDTLGETGIQYEASGYCEAPALPLGGASGDVWIEPFHFRSLCIDDSGVPETPSGLTPDPIDWTAARSPSSADGLAAVRGGRVARLVETMARAGRAASVHGRATW